MQKAFLMHLVALLRMWFWGKLNSIFQTVYMSVAMVNTATSQQDCWLDYRTAGIFLCRVCMFSVDLRGLSLASTVQKHTCEGK